MSKCLFVHKIISLVYHLNVNKETYKFTNRNINIHTDYAWYLRFEDERSTFDLKVYVPFEKKNNLFCDIL